MDQEYALEKITAIGNRIRSVLNGTQRISHLNRISLMFALNDLKELKGMLQHMEDDGDEQSCEWYAECHEGTFPDDA